MIKKCLLICCMLLLSGCSKYKEMKCTTTDYEIENAKVDMVVIYVLDTQGYVESSNKTELRKYQTAEEADKFYKENIEFSSKKSETEIEYVQAVTYNDKLLYESVKSAMENQNFKCELIK